MNNRDCPCYECKVRAVGCHASCEAYKEWQEKIKKINERERAERDYFNTLFGSMRKSQRRWGR